MSRHHPEKRPFLHPTSDTDSDVDNEQGWADVGLANQLGRGSYGSPKKNSYVTHDFSIFRAVKPDQGGTEVASETHILHNKRPEDEQKAEGSSQYPIEASTQFMQGNPSESSHRSQDSISRANVSASDPHGIEPSGTTSHIQSGIVRTSSQMSPFENEGLLASETNASVFSDLEKWSSLQFSFSSIGVLEGGDTNVNSNIESKSLQIVIPSKMSKAEQQQHQETSYSSDSKRPLSIESTFNEINLLREERGDNSSSRDNNSEIQLSPESSFLEMQMSTKSREGRTNFTVHGNEKQSLSYLDPLGDEGEKNNSLEPEKERQPFSKSPLLDTEIQEDIVKEKKDERDYYIDNNSERRSPSQSPILQMETFEKPSKEDASHIVDANERLSELYLDPLGGGGANSSSIGSERERESVSESPFLAIETREDLVREELSENDSRINHSNEKLTSIQFPMMETEMSGVSSQGRSSHIMQDNEKWSLSYEDSLGDKGGKSGFVFSGNERESFSEISLLDTQTMGGLVREDITEGSTFTSNNGQKQTSIESSMLEMETFRGPLEVETCQTLQDNARWSVSYLDPLGDEDVKSSSTSRNERHSLSKSTIFDDETLGDLVGEETSGKNSYINSSSEKQTPLQPLVMEMESFERVGGARTSQIMHSNEKWSLTHLNPLGDEEGMSSSLSNGNERKSLTNSHLIHIEAFKETTCVRHGDISERELVTKPKLIDSEVERDYTSETPTIHESVRGAGSFEQMKEPFVELRPSSQHELTRVPMMSDGPLSHVVISSNTNVEIGENNLHSSKGNERRPLEKECLQDEQTKPLTDSRRKSIGFGNERRPSRKELAMDEPSKPLRDMKRGSIMSGNRASHILSTSDIDRELESMPDRNKGRGSVNQSNRLTSQTVPAPCETESDGKKREREESEEEESPDFTSQHISSSRRNSIAAQVGERVPPEWALLLLGCLLGLATGLSVVLFNKGVHFIHDVAWAGTPKEGAAWFRLQQVIDIWHRVLLLPVVGGVIVGVMHAVLGTLDQIRASRPPQPRHTIDWLAGIKPTIKAIQAMVTLGTGCSLGPEGPSVDIGKAWANGLATIMKNNKERRIALVAAGAAAGISAGFSAPVSGMFFAIETVLRPQKAENSPPLTTAMIILASVISSTVSEIVLEETPAFTVPTYELRSAAELPLYLLLGGVCGVVSVIFVRMTAYFTELFEFLRDQIGVPPTVTPAIGGLVAGVIALKYPGVLYWGFYNVDEILHSGKSAVAPGAGLVTQLVCAKVVATAFSKGSGLVGGVYAPSLFIGAAVGSVYGTIAGKILDAALPGQDTVAHPQAYALVGMAALLAAVCSVPLTSVLLLFELTKDYHILLPLMGGIGVAIWVAAVAKQTTEKRFATSVPFGGRSFQPLGANEEGVPDYTRHEQLVWRSTSTGTGKEVELCRLGDCEGRNVVSDAELKDTIKVSQAMSKSFVKVQAIATVKETIGQILLKHQDCALVVDENDLLEGIFTFSDLEKEVMRAAESSYRGHRGVVEVDKMLVAAMCSGKGDNQGQDTDLVVCFPDMSLRAVLDIMDSSGFKQLPVVARAGKRWQDEGRHVVGLIYRDAIPHCIREEASKRIAAILAKDEEDDDGPLLDGH